MQSSPNVVVPINLSPSKTEMSLLDKYEIRISKELNHYIEITSAGERLKGGDEKRIIKKSSKLGWFRHSIRMCSSRQDIVVECSKVLGNPRLPEKHAPAGSGGGDVPFPPTEAAQPMPSR
ncbi:hypothetical protein A4A49_29615 [Nicotiana attenuata]|uniref:Uncharacterized protein n=1 Tax=Nicotiana attenuata TaxID=49451 RepID=A0A314KX11_NICAT|nr:hypothetical protein A4A49_29615 [Nicotiana attenuata]